MILKKLNILLLFWLAQHHLFAQSHKIENQKIDSLYIEQIENQKGQKPKVLHAEPLYIDLIRDLGARKGEAEFNFGYGQSDHKQYEEYEMLIEYEFAPIDRLGFEIELPLIINQSAVDSITPPNHLEGVQLAGQWSLLVDPNLNMSMALGYLHLFEFSYIKDFGNPLFKGNEFSPFLVIAKRWGQKFHSLVYTGPVWEQQYQTTNLQFHYQMHTSFHYMISGTKNFFGVEFNKEWEDDQFNMIMRPQIRVGIDDEFMLGLVTGIPVMNTKQGYSMFLRLIWEPSDY